MQIKPPTCPHGRRLKAGARLRREGALCAAGAGLVRGKPCGGSAKEREESSLTTQPSRCCAPKYENSHS